ncbi:Enoyl-[acyl-carrier-protein] reductase [NADH] [Planctomycetales bacterium 10988]|nr:Enoyl-[acyl-carrier-protein] reductase [NADH] [Planctomycetales bacterium 10988]
MGMFTGKKGLILGVANDHSIAWAIADKILQEGGECGFTHLPDRPDDAKKRNRRRVAKLTDPLDNAKFLMPMNVTSDEDIQTVMKATKEEFGKIDFMLHAIAFALMDDLKGDTIDTSREGFKTAMEISCYSLIAVTKAAKDIELFNPDAAVLTMSYYGGEKAVPGYNVMGICKAALDATVRYLAFDLGAHQVRVNALSAGPLKTLAGKGAGVDDMLPLYEAVSPLQRNITHDEVGNCGAFMLSPLSNGISGDIIHQDAGYHCMGSPGRATEKLRS